MNTFCYPVLGLGPLHLEWSAAAYERMAARWDARCPEGCCSDESCCCVLCESSAGCCDAYDDKYVQAAYRVEKELLGAIHLAGRGLNLPWNERKQL